MSHPAKAQALHIFCLCADWCVICREFEPEFERLAADLTEHNWLALDIEAKEPFLADIDVQSFPTLVIFNQDKRCCFAGVIEPRIDTLLRLVKSAQAGDLRLSESLSRPWQILLNASNANS